MMKVIFYALKGKNSLPMGANSFSFREISIWKGKLLNRITALSSSLLLTWLSTFK